MYNPYLNFELDLSLDNVYWKFRDLLGYINSLLGGEKTLPFSIAFDYPIVFLLLIPLLILLIIFVRKQKRKLLFIFSRVLIFSLLLAAIASPFTIIEKSYVNDKPEIVIIEDQTESMNMLDKSRIASIPDALQQQTLVTQRYIVGTKSAIGDAIVQNSRSDAGILLISDGNNNQGRGLDEAIALANTLGTSVHALKLNPIQSDLAIAIEGTKRVIVGNEATFDIVVRTAGVSEIKGNLTIWIDGKVKLSRIVNRSEKIQVSHKFTEIGSHSIKAEIKPQSDDYYPENNVFYKAINVVETPRVLLRSSSFTSPLNKVLRELYRVETSDELKNLNEYSAVVLDNIQANRLSANEVETLTKYVSNGGGLVVVGGESAYDRGGYDIYPSFEALLPVYPWLSEKPTENIGLLFLIDISGSTSFPYGDGTELDYIKGYVIEVINQLPANSSIGVNAFERYQYVVVPLDQYRNRDEIKNTISRLQSVSSLSNTYILPALQNATRALETFQGKRIVIMVTDGYPSDGGSRLSEEAVKMARKGLSLYIVGINVASGDDALMMDLAYKGNGVFYNLEDAPPLNLLFEEKKKEETKKTEWSVGVTDPNHFIAQNLKGTRFNVTITGFNLATPKFSARSIVVTEDGNPIVTEWRFGLGRVVAFTTDNGNKWASQVYAGNNSKLISAMVNYAVGDPERNVDPKIEASDARRDENVRIDVTSKTTPELTIDGEPLILSRVGENSYQNVTKLSKEGFYNISGYLIAVNYPAEYEKLGFNSDFGEIIAAHGGTIYGDEGAAREKLLEAVKTKGTKMLKQREDMRMQFIVAAIALFTVDVCLRRMAEIKRMRES